MRKIVKVVVFAVSLVLLSGCLGSVKSFMDDLKKQRQQEVLLQTEDLQMVKAFIKDLPSAMVYANEIYEEEELDLKGNERGQTTDTNAEIYHPIRFFESRMDDSTKAYELWLKVVKERGGHVIKYNGNVAAKLCNYVYLPKPYPEERYYYSLAPAYIEFNNQGNMVSAFVKVLKTQEMMGWVVNGHKAYHAYEFDVVLLKPVLRRIQMHNRNNFFNNNKLSTIMSKAEIFNQSRDFQTLFYK